MLASAEFTNEQTVAASRGAVVANGKAVNGDDVERLRKRVSELEGKERDFGT